MFNTFKKEKDNSETIPGEIKTTFLNHQKAISELAMEIAEKNKNNSITIKEKNFIDSYIQFSLESLFEINKRKQNQHKI